MSTVLAPVTPLYLGRPTGPVMLKRSRPSSRIRAPRTPLYQLGYAELCGLGAVPGQIVAAASPIAATAASAIAATSETVGAFAGPIGAGVGLVVGLIGGLLAGHELRAKQAKNENSAVNIAVPGFDSDLKQVWNAYKSGQISATDTQTALEQGVMPGYWTVVVPQIQPGRNGCNGGSSCPPENPGQQPCVGSIGAACCVGCYQLTPSIVGPNGALAALQGVSGSPKGPYIAEIQQVFGSKYGATSRGAYTLDFTPPAGGVTGTLASALTAGTPGSSLMPLLLIGAALFLVSR